MNGMRGRREREILEENRGFKGCDAEWLALRNVPGLFGGSQKGVTVCTKRGGGILCSPPQKTRNGMS